MEKKQNKKTVYFSRNVPTLTLLTRTSIRHQQGACWRGVVLADCVRTQCTQCVRVRPSWFYQSQNLGGTEPEIRCGTEMES
jgi:hypothetical protein